MLVAAGALLASFLHACARRLLQLHPLPQDVSLG
jgi:hypothetical protein